MRRGPIILALVPGLAWGAWPADSAWAPMTQGGAPLVDPAGDANQPAFDLIGDATTPAAWWYADSTTLWFRLRVQAAPDADPTQLAPGAWGLLWELDGDETIDFAVAAVGRGGDVTVFASRGTPGVTTAGPYTDLATYGWIGDGAVRVVAAPGGTAFVDLQLPLTAVLTEMGRTVDASMRWIPFTSPSSTIANLADTGGCDGDVDPCAQVALVAADAVVLDADGDFLLAAEELARLTDPNDGDTDDDGVLDGLDPNPLACDADHDGLNDGLELGLVVPVADTAPGVCFTPDAAAGSTTDPRDADSDDGGMIDGLEDANRNGRVDRWETDPEDPTDDADTDGDGLADVLEGTDDPDLDGIPSFLDDDSDGDGVKDALDGREDPDGDDLPAWLDPDADGDGISDGLEGRADPDGDGLGAWLDLDSDGDGVGDSDEGVDDLDGDRKANHLDTDADGDGVNDGVEGLADVDCDGKVDFLDPDDDGGFCDTDLPTGVVDDRPFGDPDVPVTPPAGQFYGGGGCRHAPGGALPLVVLAAAVAARGRRRRAPAIALAATLGAAWVSAPAEAAEIDAQRLRLSVDGWRFLATEDARLASPGSFGATAFIDHASRPLVLHHADGEVDVLRAVTSVRVLGHVTPIRRFRFGMELPVHAALRGVTEAPAVLGDLRLSTKVGLLDQPRGAPVALAAVADLVLPTGAAWASLGERMVAAQIGVAARAHVAERFVAAAELGFRTGTGASLGLDTAGPALTWGAGASVAVVDPLLIGVEADGAWAPAQGLGGAPIELLGHLRGRVAGDLVITAGAGGGLTDGLGAPAWRVLVGLGWTPGLAPHPPITTAGPPGCGAIIVRALGAAGEYFQHAAVDLQPIPGQVEAGCATTVLQGSPPPPDESGFDARADDHGVARLAAAPGRYFVQVSFEGRASELREVVITRDGTTDVSIVLLEHTALPGSGVPGDDE